MSTPLGLLGSAASSAYATTSPGEATFGSRSPPSPGSPASARTSARPQAPDSGLTRTWTGTGCGADSSSAVARRAYSLRPGATASSRSTRTTSAPERSAFATVSGRSPGA